MEEQPQMSFREALDMLTKLYEEDPDRQVDAARRIYCTTTVRCEISLYPDLENPGKFTVSLDPMPEDSGGDPAVILYSDASVEPDEILYDLQIDGDIKQWELSVE